MRNKIPYIIGASTIGLLSLILIQVKWMQQSRNLIEEQFDQKVSMALCQAVESINGSCYMPPAVAVCGVPQEKSLWPVVTNPVLATEEDEVSIRTAVGHTLAQYQIDLPFELEVHRDTPLLLLPDEEAESKLYSCSLDPMAELESPSLSIRFPDKQTYVLGQMGFMLILSILILLFITGVFIYANYYLLRQQRLSERNQEFFNHMAHEFKTPLTNIGLAAKLIAKKPTPELLKIINTESQQLNAQVNRVLSMASLEAGYYQIKKEKIELTSWVRELVASMDIYLQSKGAKVEIVDQATDLWIVADRFHLANSIKNILENALKYCATTAEIVITIEELPGKARLSIQDNGIGMSPDKRKRVFDKFYRIEQEGDFTILGLKLESNVVDAFHLEDRRGSQDQPDRVHTEVEQRATTPVDVARRSQRFAQCGVVVGCSVPRSRVSCSPLPASRRCVRSNGRGALLSTSSSDGSPRPLNWIEGPAFRRSMWL